MSSGYSLRWPSAVTCYRLDGPAGAAVDTLIAALVDAGLTVECISRTTAYRVSGDTARIQVIAEQIAELGNEITLKVEIAPTDVVNLRGTLAPARPFRRSVTVHGSGPALYYIVRAIDAGTLTVTPVGQCRFEVRGRTADLLVWLSEHVHKVPVDEVLKLWNLTVEAARAEDADLPQVPVVKIVMPNRKTETTRLRRNDDGQLIEVTQVETDLKEDE